MPTLSESQPQSRNYHGDIETLSHIYRDTQLAGGVLTISRAAEIQKRVEHVAYAYRDRGAYSLRRW